MSDHYDRYNGMEELLSTNLASLGTDCISRQKAINALYEWECDNKDDRDAIDVINGLQSIQPVNCSEFPNNSDAISRQAAIDIIEDFPHGDVWNVESMEEMVDRIKQLPSAQPKMGRWIHHPEIGWGETWMCDQCGEKTTSTVMGKPRANFCPNCGAKMEVNNESN